MEYLKKKQAEYKEKGQQCPPDRVLIGRKEAGPFKEKAEATAKKKELTKK